MAFSKETWISRVKKELPQYEVIDYYTIKEKNGISKNGKQKYQNRTWLRLHCKLHGDFVIASNNLFSHKHKCPNCKNITSQQESAWLDRIEIEKNIKIHRSQTLIIDNKNYSVDGFDKNTNTIYQYHGCYFHKCSKCFTAKQLRHIKADIPAKDARQFEIFKESNYNIVILNEHDDKYAPHYKRFERKTKC